VVVVGVSGATTTEWHSPRSSKMEIFKEQM